VAAADDNDVVLFGHGDFLAMTARRLPHHFQECASGVEAFYKSGERATRTKSANP
jgi:hypothetical protein